MPCEQDSFYLMLCRKAVFSLYTELIAVCAVPGLYSYRNAVIIYDIILLKIS